MALKRHIAEHNADVLWQRKRDDGWIQVNNQWFYPGREESLAAPQPPLEKQQIFLTLKRKRWLQIQEGTERFEFRENKRYWQSRLMNKESPVTHVLLVNGQNPKLDPFMVWTVKDVTIVKADCSEVIAIHLGEATNLLGNQEA